MYKFNFEFFRLNLGKLLNYVWYFGSYNVKGVAFLKALFLAYQQWKGIRTEKFPDIFVYLRKIWCKNAETYLGAYQVSMVELICENSYNFAKSSIRDIW